MQRLSGRTRARSSPRTHPLSRFLMANREVLSIEEMARLWDAIDQPHLHAFLIGMISTVARPAAVLQLTRFQCDLHRNVIDLNPAGRARTKKRRPVVPMASALRPWIECGSDHLVSYR